MFGFLSVGITVISSVIASVFVVWATVFKGQSGDGVGIIFIPLFFPCLAAPIPGLICYFLCQLIFAKNKIYTNNFISVVIGIFFACLSMVVFYSTLIGTVTHKEEKLVKSAETEMVFFKAALEGKYKDDVIREHYKELNFDKQDRQAVEDLLYQKDRERFPLEPLLLLMELFDNDGEILGYLVDQPEIPVEVKRKLAANPNHLVVFPMAVNPDTPQDILLILSAHNEVSVGEKVRTHNNAPPFVDYINQIHEAYQRLDTINQGDRDMPGERREYKVPGFTSDNEKRAWMTLVNDHRPEVRAWVASNQNAPVSILVGMSNDSSEEVCGWLILNNSTPKYVKQKIAKRYSSSIADFIGKLAKSNERRVKFAVVNAKDATGTILEGLVRDPESTVLKTLARNSKTPVNTLVELSKKSDYQVQVAVLQNPNTPEDIRKDLLQKHSGKVPVGR